jgi:hypothetical protein
MNWAIFSRGCFTCFATLFALVCTQAAHADPKITAVATDIQFYNGQTSGPVRLLFEVDGLKTKPKVWLISTSPGGPDLNSTLNPDLVAESGDGAFWELHGSVNGLPLNSSFNVLLAVQVGDGVKVKISDVLSYSVSNKIPAVDAEVSPGSDTIFLDRYRETDFTVNVKGRPLRGLAVCQSTLADPNTGNHLGEENLGMYLAGSDVNANPQLGNPYLTLTAASTKVQLKVLPAFKDNGVFTGSIGLCSASKAAVATLKLTVNSTSWLAKVDGAALIVTGIGLYVLVTVVLRQRSRQLSALLPAARLIEANNALRSTAERVAHRAKVMLPVLLGDPRTVHSLRWLNAQLAVARLKKAGYLPPLLTNPFQPPDAGTDYQQYLQGISAQEVNYAIIVQDGLTRVMSLWEQLNEDSAREALVKLDQLALEADSTSDPMRPKVDALVNAIAPRHKEFAAMLTDTLNRVRAGVGSQPSVHEIMVQLDTVSGIGWIIWAFLNFLFGCSVLILSNHGFGTWQDLLKCFLWGLGIQATGQGLQALAPSSTATTFSLQIGH